MSGISWFHEFDDGDPRKSYRKPAVVASGRTAVRKRLREFGLYRARSFAIRRALVAQARQKFVAQRNELRREIIARRVDSATIYWYRHFLADYRSHCGLLSNPPGSDLPR